MKEGKYFNVRVYGLIVNAKNELLIAEEFHYGTFMRKLPGGGLQFGEGIRDCLVREIQEELQITINEFEHFHTTDFFIQSAFNSDHQVFGVYFLVSPPDELDGKFLAENRVAAREGEEFFKWVPIKDIKESDFTFPADKAAIKKFLTSL
jgi:8-oxo-dGTP diphosphatase